MVDFCFLVEADSLLLGKRRLKPDDTAGKIEPMGCIIFDLDGTLIDSEPACNQALLDLLPELPDNLVELIGRYRGKKLTEVFADIEVRLSRKLPDEFEQTYRARVAAIFDSELQAMPGAEEALTAIKLPMCVASSGPMSKIRHALELRIVQIYPFVKIAPGHRSTALPPRQLAMLWFRHADGRRQHSGHFSAPIRSLKPAVHS